MTGYKDGSPMMAEIPYTDYTGGEHTVFAVMAALMHRLKTGQGQFIDISPEEVVASPQFEARSFFVDIDHPAVAEAKYPGAPFLMSNTPWQVNSPAPTLGQHNRELLGERLGLSDRELAQLRAMEVI